MHVRSTAQASLEAGTGRRKAHVRLLGRFASEMAMKQLRWKQRAQRDSKVQEYSSLRRLAERKEEEKQRHLQASKPFELTDLSHSSPHLQLVNSAWPVAR